jgi:hypothetical protein
MRVQSPGLRAAAAAIAALAASAGAPALAQTSDPPPPRAWQKDALPPVEMFARRDLHHPPLLDGSRASVKAFVAWAGMSAPSEREDARAAIARAGNSADSDSVARYLCRFAHGALGTDHTLALLDLAILGELKNPTVGLGCLRDILWTPLPTEGTPDPELGGFIEVESLATVQAKAVDGLAYLRSAAGDAEVFKAIQSHPSRIVRAEAIDAYLWNHGDSSEAKARLLPLTKEHGEEIFLDRVRKEDGEGAETFDPKLEAFLRLHPELRPVEDQQGGANPPKNETPGVTPPPPLAGFAFDPTCGSTAPLCNGTCPEGRRCVVNAVAACTCVTQ